MIHSPHKSPAAVINVYTDAIGMYSAGTAQRFAWNSFQAKSGLRSRLLQVSNLLRPVRHLNRKAVSTAGKDNLIDA